MKVRDFVLVPALLTMVCVTPVFPQAASPDPATPRPIDAVDTVFVEEMTWMEVRDAMKAGKTTVLIATGGIEQNGPYLVTGKHNVVLRATTEAIARKLENALVGTIIGYVPEGDHQPPTGHMRYPGTISLREETFKAVLTDICTSFKAHQFENIVLIGDSGGNQKGMQEVAEELNTRWAEGQTRAYYIPEYYDYPGLTQWLEVQGIRQVDEGIHDDFGISSIMMTVDPRTVRMEQRLAKGLFRINGVDMSPPEKTIEMGRKAVEWRANITVDAIRKAIAAKR